MGINFSCNNLGANNINLYGVEKLEYDKFQGYAGLFANISLNGGRLLKGIFAETIFKGNALNVIYATDSHETANIQGNIGLRLYKNDSIGIDLNFYHNTLILSPFKFVHIGGNISWSFPEGHLLAVGVSLSPLFHCTNLDGMCKINFFKSDNHGINVDLITNICLSLRGPFANRTSVVTSLSISYDLLHAFDKTKHLKA